MKEFSSNHKMENSEYLPPDLLKRLNKRHLQSAFVRAFAAVFILLTTLPFCLSGSVDFGSFIVTGIVVALLVFVPILIFQPILKAIRRRASYEILSFIINAFEVINYTVFFYFMGGLRSGYLVLVYVGLIAYVGATAPRRYIIIVTFFCVFSFSSMVLMEHFGFIPHQNLHGQYIFQTADIISILVITSVLIYLTAFICGYAPNLLRKNRNMLRLQNLELKASRAELEKYSQNLKTALNNLKDAQTQLVRSEKMAVLGGLVAGVAHEISTPLGVGLMSASFLNDVAEDYGAAVASGILDKDELKKKINKIMEASSLILINLQKAADLLNSFKHVAVDQSGEHERVFNVRYYIEEILKSLQPRYKRTAYRITVNCPKELEIKSFPGAISQIVTNLVMNSLVHGFDGQDSGRIAIDISVEGDDLVFHYTDNGKGMDQETMKKVFDPFFTTRRGQGGSGLGMYIVYNLITQKLNGQIGCKTLPNHGTEFMIRIPLKSGPWRRV